MKLKNILKGIISGLCVFLTSCSHAIGKNATTFDWLATESAPSHYPMQIINGDFFYHGQGGSKYIPSGGTLYAGWGNSISTHVGGDERYPLPDRLNIIFFSYTEKQFYKGELELPYEKMLELFREGIAANKQLPHYREVMVGIAPGGAVSVWMTGVRTKEVFFGQAQKIDLRYSRVLGLRFDNQQEEDAFIYKQLTNVLKPEELESLKKDGVPFGLWARYRNLYRWIPVLTPGTTLKRSEIGIRYLNGESSPETLPFKKETSDTTRPLPSRVVFVPIISGVGRPYVVNFDEYELMETFEKLGAKGELVNIEFDPREPRQASRLRVYNDKESIELKKTIISDR